MFGEMSTEDVKSVLKKMKDDRDSKSNVIVIDDEHLVTSEERELSKALWSFEVTGEQGRDIQNFQKVYELHTHFMQMLDSEEGFPSPEIMLNRLQLMDLFIHKTLPVLCSLHGI